MSRPVALFYANVTREDIVFFDELAELSASVPRLTVVHALERPPQDWVGESGRITEDGLRRHLPRQFRRFEYFICGSGAMMDAVETALIDAGVPFRNVSTERLDMV